MCGRFTNAITWRELVEHYQTHDQVALNMKPRYNIAPTQEIPIVRMSPNPKIAGREVVRARWGLVPSWAKDLSYSSGMINARADTVDEKPAYRNAFKLRRCLVPADGFYEWRSLERGEKQPYRFCLSSRQHFAFAGLWDQNARLGVTSCTIITTEPNTVVKPFHYRMPVILSREDYGDWLASETSPEAAKALLKPYEGEMVAYPVNKAVGSPKNDEAALIEPVEA